MLRGVMNEASATESSVRQTLNLAWARSHWWHHRIVPLCLRNVVSKIRRVNAPDWPRAIAHFDLDQFYAAV